MRYFIELVEVTADPVLREKYKTFIADSTSSDLSSNVNALNQFGHKWTGAFNFADPMFQGSSLDLFNVLSFIHNASASLPERPTYLGHLMMKNQ